MVLHLNLTPALKFNHKNGPTSKSNPNPIVKP